MTNINEKRVTEKAHRILRLVLIIGIMLFIFCACGYSGLKEDSINNQSSGPESEQKIKQNILIRTVDTSENPVKGVKGVLIGFNGEIIDTFKTNDEGEANKQISLSIDKRYPNEKEEGFLSRGTVTIISFKEGYQESVTFESGVSGGDTVQNIVMNPLVEGQRNEPNVYLGYNHHLEILSLVEKYAKIIGEKAHQ